MDHSTIISDTDTVRQMLEHRASTTPNYPYLRFGDVTLSCGELDQEVNRYANFFVGLGVRAGERIAVMLPNSLDAVFVFFSLAKLGAVQVPVNIHLRGQTLAFLIEHSEPNLLIADQQYAEALAGSVKQDLIGKLVWRNEIATSDWRVGLSQASTAPPPGEPKSSDVLSILYTSGTTGPPKGVLVTDKMHRAAAWASAVVADVGAGDTMYLWEPIYHVTGTEVLIVGLEHELTLALTERFSASKFWPDVRRYGVTHIHYVGGVLQILLRGPRGPEDDSNSVRVAWGGGAPSHLWASFSSRFSIELRENYGMTETSSLTSMNMEGRHGSVGRPAPFFDVSIRDSDDRGVATGETGEICVKELEAGLITCGYFRNPAATEKAFLGGWFHTGDLGQLDEDGFLYYAGRLKDSLRRRGENVSAWEIERVVEQLTWVRECALIGIPDELGDESLKLFVTVVDSGPRQINLLADWCRDQLGRFQVPEFIEFIDEFPKTATQRIQKEQLSKTTEMCWRLTADGTLTPPI